MKINLETPIMSLDGDQLTSRGSLATVKSVSVDALTNSTSRDYEKKISIAKKLMNSNGEVSLKAGEVETIKNAVKEIPTYTAQMVYQFEQAIDPVEEEPK